MLNEQQIQNLRTKVLETLNDYLDEQGVDFLSAAGEDWNTLKKNIGQALDEVKRMVDIKSEGDV